MNSPYPTEVPVLKLRRLAASSSRNSCFTIKFGPVKNNKENSEIALKIKSSSKNKITV